MRGRVSRRWLLAAAAALVVAAAVLIATNRRPAHPAGSASMRTVLVVDSTREAPATEPVASRDCISRASTCVNGRDGIVVTYSVGRLPPEGEATVVTDTNCEADENGISHCLNQLRFENGSLATVRHDHSMRNDPCLAPGERIRVARA